MDVVNDLTHWILHIRVDLWVVIVAALVLAWLDRAAHIRSTPRYDAWWLFNVPASAERKLMREFRHAGRRRPRRDDALSPTPPARAKPAREPAAAARPD